MAAQDRKTIVHFEKLKSNAYNPLLINSFI
jgi:hypothetical protein